LEFYVDDENVELTTEQVKQMIKRASRRTSPVRKVLPAFFVFDIANLLSNLERLIPVFKSTYPHLAGFDLHNGITWIRLGIK
jgi:hypothetical protein